MASPRKRRSNRSRFWKWSSPGGESSGEPLEKIERFAKRDGAGMGEGEDELEIYELDTLTQEGLFAQLKWRGGRR